MYTGLRVKVTVKEPYRSMVEAIEHGANWRDFSEQFPFLKEFAAQSRAEFIPRGVLCYMPTDWERGDFPNQTATDGFNGFTAETGEWAFQCSLKNYEGEIEQFFREVLPELISSAAHIEYYYEEWEESAFYEWEDGEIKPRKSPHAMDEPTWSS